MDLLGDLGAVDQLTSSKYQKLPAQQILCISTKFFRTLQS